MAMHRAKAWVSRTLGSKSKNFDDCPTATPGSSTQVSGWHRSHATSSQMLSPLFSVDLKTADCSYVRPKPVKAVRTKEEIHKQELDDFLAKILIDPQSLEKDVEALRLYMDAGLSSDEACIKLASDSFSV
mmetsp:Transcript_26166/g.59037  ORF Transcript_26166/g.59037 Transcript_26166/m.59037 type:complete len:130 (-) Transcript_26166:8-397(-)